MEYAAKPRARYQQVLDRIPVIGDVVRSPMGALGVIIVAGFLFVVIFAPYIAPYHYTEQDIPSRLEGPSRQYPLGTDELGRDLLSRLIYGSRIALGVAVPSVAIALTGGILLGLISGYVGGIVDDVVVVFIDSINAFPAVILALAILALLGPALTNEILVIGLAWIPGYARVTRAQTLSVKQNVYIEAERSLGASTARIILFHVMPNVVAPVLILAAMDLPVVITFEAGLSFLGLGVPPPFPSWGSILATGFNFVRQSPWPITWAGLTLIVTTLGFTLFGEALRDVLDPRLSGTRGV
ncbi:MAG: ABC transporter permease [Candidatus Promineifilaceae bacterium]|nr:ABC transporter permease [Candidatus Promineifilaceae bacterium]